MDEDQGKRTDSDQQIVYVKENAALKFVVGSSVALVSVVVFLFFIGFLMSYVGFRPPTFDKDILQDQWDRKVHDKAQSFGDCRSKDGTVEESWPPTCTYENETFTQSITDACGDLSTAGEALPPECGPSGKSDAYRAGDEAGQAANKLKDTASSFVDGLKQGYSE